MSEKSTPIVFVPDASYLTEDGVLVAGEVTVIADLITYGKIKKILEEKGGMTNDSKGKYRIGSVEGKA